MRLIDADLLIERIRRNNDLPWYLDKTMQVAFESCVKHSLVAYDVDGVITQLNKLIADAPPGGTVSGADIARIIRGGGISNCTTETKTTEQASVKPMSGDMR